jgi:dienelactone hydrolase
MRALRLTFAAAVVAGFLACSGGASSTSSTTRGGPGGGAASTSTTNSGGSGGVPATGSTTTTTSSSATSSTGTGAQTGSGGGGGGDAGAPDASGTGGSGGASPDAGPLDASAPAIACTDAPSDVYVTPPNLPPMTSATRGDVVRCADDTTLSLAQVQADVTAQGIMTPMKTGVTYYRVAFRTTRGDGSPGVSTARVYLPATPAALPLPVVVIGHPTDGLAAACTPSMDATSNEDLALPWAGLGLAVIVPDYAGLGNEGVQGYLDNHDQAYSLLDGARALRKMLAPGVFSQQVLAVGWSQGGGAVLSAQALATSYGADGTLAGVIAFAPEWPTRMNSFDYVHLLSSPTALTEFSATNVSTPDEILTASGNLVVAAMRSYAYFYNYVGPTAVGDAFPAMNESAIETDITTQCEVVLGGLLQALSPFTVEAVLDPTFSATLVACIDSSGQAAGCTDPAKSYYAFLESNFVTSDPAGAPVLLVQGLADYIMPAASEAACDIAKMEGDGLTPQVCTDAAALHTNVVGRNMDFAITWATAVLAGQTPPTCSSAGMPACAP